MSRWIIHGTLKTTSPLHIGSGVSEQVDKKNSKGESFLTSESGVALDVNKNPCIPGTSLKGVLSARLNRYFGKEQPDWFQQAFGLVKTVDNKQVNMRGRLEFQTALLMAEQAVGLNKLTSHARDRKTKAVANKKLFTQHVVPVGTVFNWEMVINESLATDDQNAETDGKKHFVFDDKVISEILWALNLFDGTSQGICIGANTAIGFGQIKWSLDSVVPIPSFTDWVAQANSTSLDKWFANLKPKVLIAAASGNPASAERLFAMPLTIPMHGPFLSALSPDGKKSKTSDPDFHPLRKENNGHDGNYLYRGRSLHGALRSQAERIAHTIGIEVQDGTDQTPLTLNDLNNVAAKLDPVALLFGAPGWRSVLKLSDFEATTDCIPHKQEFVAIDRFTGGASDGAKFNGESVLSPKLQGHLLIDLDRLLNASADDAALNRIKSAIGLLAFTLRDLDEGDIGLGYGASAKGYGQVDWEQAKAATEFAQLFADAAKRLNIQFTLDDCLKCVGALAGDLQAPFALPIVSNAATHALDIPSADQFVAPSGKSFHNPYQFLPTKRPDENNDQWLARSKFENRDTSHHWHDRYASLTIDGKPVFSGRMVCSITTKTPTFIGAQQTPGANSTIATTVAPFKLGEQIAIPATTIRGMLGSLLEAASQSSLRVLHDASLSMRRQIHDAPLSAIGRIVEVDGKLKLEPLCLPTLDVKARDQVAVIPTAYRKMFPDSVQSLRPDTLKCLFGDWKAQPELLKDLSTYTPQKPNTCLMGYPEIRIKNGEIDLSSFVDKNGNSEMLHIKGDAAGRQFLLGVRAAQNVMPVPSSEYAKRKDEPTVAAAFKNRLRVRGVLRVMGAGVRSKEMPTTRKHEVFVPMKYFDAKTSDGKPTVVMAPRLFDSSAPTPDAALFEAQKQYFAAATFEIDKNAKERFEELSVQRTETQEKKSDLNELALLPFHPVGTARNVNEGNRNLQLKAGDLVYFRPSADGTTVAEIAFSSIWRSRVENEQEEKQTTATFFDFISKELRPFDANRNRISPAEMMLGFVQGGDAKTADEKLISPKVMAMASKVRFSFGEANGEVKLGKEVTLKILGGPKLPSPSLYLRREGAGDISKPDLAQHANKFRPRGRKMYLHAMRNAGSVARLNEKGQPSEKGGNQPWEHVPFAQSEKNNNQRTKIKPIEAGQEFLFHVDFDNLSQTELELLCFVIKPFESFEHRIGLGKPIGLGSIEVKPLALGLVNRQQRYTRGQLTAPRFSAIWNAANVTLPKRFANLNTNISSEAIDVTLLAQAGAKATQARDPALLRSIVLLGNPDAVKLPVHTPQLDGQPIENETFKWFADNEGSAKKFNGPMQTIGAVEAKSLALPGLSGRPRAGG